jgi:hypothetical protein
MTIAAAKLSLNGEIIDRIVASPRCAGDASRECDKAAAAKESTG